MTLRTYSQLEQFDTLEERYNYLKLNSTIGVETFGSYRWLNQGFYKSREWKQARSRVIARDEGMDLGTYDTPIRGAHLIHHMNPITMEDIETGSDNLLNPEFLITVGLGTHNAIHFGNEGLLPRPFVERKPGDTKLW